MEYINIRSSRELFFFKCALFFSLGLALFGYILNFINFEFSILFILILSLGVAFRYRHHFKLDRQLLIWLFIVLFFWSIHFFVLIHHGIDSPRAESVFASNNNVLIMVFLTMLLWLLRPSLDFFWYLIWFACSLLVVLYLLEVNHAGLDYLLNQVRLGGAYSHPSKYGVYNVAFLAILLGSFIWAYKKGIGHLIFSVSLALVLLISIVSSQTRTAWLGLPEAMVAWTIFYYFFLKSKLHFSHLKGLLAVIFFYTMVAISLYASPVFDVFEKRVTQGVSDVEKYLSHKTFSTSVGYRLLSYDAALAVISEHPIFGIGETNFISTQRDATAKVAESRFNIKFAGLSYNHLHNQFLMTWFTKGIFAFLSIITIFVFLFAFFIKKIRSANNFEDATIPIAGFAFTVASFLSFLPESPLFRGDTTFHFFLISTLLVVFSLRSQTKS